MKKEGLIAGVFVVDALLLFSIGLFLIGDSHQAFTHHITFYTEMFNVNGLAPGVKVRVAGYVSGQIENIGIPHRPSDKFRIKFQVDAKLRKLIRDDSVVTVETDGVVGDKFLLVHDGTDQSQEASIGATLSGKEPIEISAVIAKVSTVIDQANGVIVDVQGKLNVALDTATRTINNADGLITLARSGNGPVGVLLNDKQTAAQLKQTVANRVSWRPYFEEDIHIFSWLLILAGGVRLNLDSQVRVTPQKLLKQWSNDRTGHGNRASYFDETAWPFAMALQQLTSVPQSS
jgi:phospholipid/cholesterol/gamma-HCH transport system substrate-binding protein